MWPFRPKKTLSGPPDNLQPAVADLKPCAVTVVMIEQLIEAYYGRGRRFALFYANMCGFQADMIPSARFAEFFSIINGEPNFTADGVRYAVDRLISELDAGDTYADTMLYGVSGERNELRPMIEPVRDEARRRGYRALFDDAGFEPAAYLRETVTLMRQADIACILEKLDEKRDFLKPLFRRAMLKGKNKYGEVEYDEFWKEITEFIRHFFPEGSLSFFHDLIPSNAIAAHVLPWLQDDLDTSTLPQDGFDFEHWCAEQLSKQGWQCVVSKAAGDQGIDIEAHQGGRTVAIQCKRYSQPIGNKAVQEAHTGMVHYRADAACVIGTGGFTRAARELAQNTGVILLDAEHISDFTEIFASPKVS